MKKNSVPAYFRLIIFSGFLALWQTDPHRRRPIAFACKDKVKVYLDESLKRFEVVYAGGGGDEHNTVEVTIPLLESLSGYEAWVDVCKGW